jgi:hypothetical protein
MSLDVRLNSSYNAWYALLRAPRIRLYWVELAIPKMMASMLCST